MAANLKGDWSKDERTFPFDILTTFANELRSPDDGNVEFQAKSLTGETKSLYANRTILSRRCEYYRTSSSPQKHLADYYSV